MWCVLMDQWGPGTFLAFRPTPRSLSEARPTAAQPCDGWPGGWISSGPLSIWAFTQIDRGRVQMYDCGVIHLHAFSCCACVFVVLFAAVCWCLGLIWPVRARSPLAHPASFDGLGQPSSAIPRVCSVVLWSVGRLVVGCWVAAGLFLCCVCVWVCVVGLGLKCFALIRGVGVQA